MKFFLLTLLFLGCLGCTKGAERIPRYELTLVEKGKTGEPKTFIIHGDYVIGQFFPQVLTPLMRSEKRIAVCCIIFNQEIGGWNAIEFTTKHTAHVRFINYFVKGTPDRTER